jgi:simple sugar transport system ATP-binding protein
VGAASLIQVEGISKHFGAIRALEDVSLAVDAGEIVGLMGDNGAGKSTLVKVLAGNYRPTAGEYRIDGERVSFASPAEARGRGIEVVYQDLALCNNLSAAANVFLGREPTRRMGPFRVLDHQAMNERAGALFRELASETRPRDLVDRMSGGQRQAVAIARTRLADAKLILMDEPTAAISVRQVAQVLALVGRLKRQGHAVVLISHRMPDVFGVCDRIVVMRRGRKVADKAIADFLARGGHGPHHGGDRPCVTRPPPTRPRSTTSCSKGGRRPRSRGCCAARSCGSPWPCSRWASRWPPSRRGSPRPATSATSSRTSASSPSWRSGPRPSSSRAGSTSRSARSWACAAS